MSDPPPACFAYVGARTTRKRNARGNGINVRSPLFWSGIGGRPEPAANELDEVLNAW